MGLDEEVQILSSLVVIHMVGAVKMLLKSLSKTLPCVHHTIKKGLPLLAVHTPHIGAVV